VLGNYLPESLFDRPKQGFSLPIGAWLVGPLREWVQDLLDPSRQASSGLLDPSVVAECWQSHSSGSRDRSRELWAMLMLESWFEECKSPVNATWASQFLSTERSAVGAYNVVSQSARSAA